jgi:HAD superfamily hydrolase (TIGR01484 family)
VRPIEELDAGVARAIEGIVFDIDDTVTRGGVIEEVAFGAIHRARRAGLRCIAVTGRPLGWVDVLAATWPIELAIGENGAGWAWREGRALHEDYFEAQPIRAEQSALLERVRARVRAEMPDVRESLDARARRCDFAFDIGETVSLPHERIEDLVRLIEREGARCSVSSVHAHAVPGAWDKAVGTSLAAERVLGIEREYLRTRFLFVGDSGNDAAAFAFFAHTAAVANVREHLDALPVRPTWIAPGDRGLGFAEIVARLIDARSESR